MRGQALVESLFVYIFVFLMSFCVIEIARLQAFKALLQTSVNYYAKYLSLEEMRLIKNHTFDLNSKKIESNTMFEKRFALLIEKDLSLMGTSSFAFDHAVQKKYKNNVWLKIDFIAQHTSQSPPGIHIKAQTCLPVLFSSFFQIFLPKNNIEIGRKINDPANERNCLGEFVRTNKNTALFQAKTPVFWFRVRAAGYSPWPASTQIFFKGLGISKKIHFIDDSQREKFIKRLDEVNFEKKQ